jgi:chromate reductase
MSNPKILVFSGSIRTGSYNVRLAALAAKELTQADGDVTLISLQDYPLPLYDADSEAGGGPPAEAVNLKRLFEAHHGVFIASPEYNASVTPLLKNTIDWISRVREGREAPLAAFRNRVFALGAASPGAYGGMRSLMALRQVLELGCGALVLPGQISVREAADAFDELGHLADDRSAKLLANVAARLVQAARQVAAART